MNKVFAFLGADHKCGTSQICQCVAELTASENPLHKVLLLHAHSSAGTDYSPAAAESMERIRPYLADRLLDMEEITEKARWKDNLSVIGGADKPGSDGLYHPDMAGFFLDRLADYYDIILCDCGADIENGLALGSLFKAGRIYVVLSQSETAIRRYEWLRPLYEKLGLTETSYVINRFRSGSVYSGDYMEKRLGLTSEKMFTVRETKNGDSSETDGKSLLYYRDGRFRKNIRAIEKDILKRQNQCSNTISLNI